jgi:hypothetical protein
MRITGRDVIHNTLKFDINLDGLTLFKLIIIFSQYSYTCIYRLQTYRRSQTLYLFIIEIILNIFMRKGRFT